MSVRTVQTSFTSAAVSSIPTASTITMTAVPNVLAAVDLNTAYPPGLVPESVPMTKGLAGRARPYSGPQSNGSINWNNSRSFNRPSNKRYSPGMRSPSSYHQAQNQSRRPTSTGSQKSMKYTDVQANGSGPILDAPLYQRTSRFDPFGDSNETPLSPSPIITSSHTSQPLYTHFYYYDSITNRPTLAYADDKNSVNAANLTTSTNILLDTLLNGGGRRSPSPPRPVETLPRPSSPPQSPRPRAAAISRPNPPISVTPAPTISDSAPSTVIVSPLPSAPIKVSKAQRDAIARVVANMLLNRADGVSRRGRRCSQPYVKSGLSRVVFVE